MSDAQDLESFLDIPIHYVTGNCDYYSIAAPSSRVVEVLGKRFFLTHGHNHGVKFSLDHLRFLANEEGYDCILFGHTHIPLMEYEGDTLIMNPGSISLPRNSDYPTFAIIQIDDKACIHGTLEEFKKLLKVLTSLIIVCIISLASEVDTR